MGRATGDVGLFKVKRFCAHTELVPDGSQKGNVWGTYIHGIFDNDLFRRDLINSLRTRRGLAPSPERIDFEKERDHALDRWADVLRKSIDLHYIKDLIS